MGQVALRLLVTRPEAAVQKLAKVFDDNQHLSFLDLPGECRNEVYKFIFFSALPKIVVTRNITNPTGATYFEKDSDRYITHVLRFNRNLLLTCKTINFEAKPLLSPACTLAVYRHDERLSPITCVPTVYLQGIRRLEVEVQTFIWVPRELLPSLKKVTLTHCDLDSDGMLLHSMGCSRCGSETELLRELTYGIQDWEWKCKQFMHTAKEEGFTIELAVAVVDYDGDHVTFTIDMEQRKIKQIVADECGRESRTFSDLDDLRDNWTFEYDY